MAHTTITIAGDAIKDAQELNITISVAAVLRIDAQHARRRVTGWLVDNVGNMLIGGTPQLVIGQQTVWRVPVLLGSTRRGIIGEVGIVDVDTESGELLITDESPKRILDNARTLASSTQNAAG